MYHFTALYGKEEEGVERAFLYLPAVAILEC
jgi:hypothetical protein